MKVFGRTIGLLWVSLLLGPFARAQEESVAPELPERFARFDLDGDRKISSRELPAAKREELLKRLDRNRDGALDAAELQAFDAVRRERGKQGQEKEKTDPVETVRVLSDIPYAEGRVDGKNYCTLDLYVPAGDRARPVLIYIHGGGLYKGEKSQGEGIGRGFAAEGFLGVSIDYRLSPAVKHPEHIRDVARAFRWVHDRIESYGGDPDRIFVLGGSGGGYLTALLALDERYLEEQGLSTDHIRAAIPVTGLMDVRTVPGTRREVVWGSDPVVWEDASPIVHVRSDAPPLLLIWADGDTEKRRELNRKTVEALRQAGHPEVESREIEGRTHNTLRTAIETAGDPARTLILDFLERHGAHESSGD